MIFVFLVDIGLIYDNIAIEKALGVINEEEGCIEKMKDFFFLSVLKEEEEIHTSLPI